VSCTFIRLVVRFCERGSILVINKRFINRCPGGSGRATLFSRNRSGQSFDVDLVGVVNRQIAQPQLDAGGLNG
jgi:hypothetical protein